MSSRSVRTKLEATALRALLLLGIAVTATPAQAESGGQSSYLSVSVKVERSCVVDTDQVSWERVRGGVSVGGSLELGCSGDSPARVAFSGDSSSHWRNAPSGQPGLAFEGSGVRTVQPIPNQVVAQSAAARPVVFVVVNF